ncbi:unnamed protein product, partial [Rotaria magnacalcarata]
MVPIDRTSWDVHKNDPQTFETR